MLLLIMFSLIVLVLCDIRTPTLIVAGGLDTIPGLGFGPACAPVELGSDRFLALHFDPHHCQQHPFHYNRHLQHHHDQDLLQVLQRDGWPHPDPQHNAVWPRGPAR